MTDHQSIPMASLNTQIQSIISTDNALLQSFTLHFDTNTNFIENSPNQKSLTALEANQNLKSAESMIKPKINTGSVLLNLNQTNHTVGIHFQLENRYIGSKIVKVPSEKLSSFNTFEDILPCKIEVETVDGNL